MSMLKAVSGCDAFVCCVGCLSLVPGLVRRVVNQVAFFPPRPPGYHVTEEKQVFLVETDYGLSPLPDLTAEGIAVDTVRMWTRRGNIIHGFHFRRADARCTLLFSHGNSTDIGIMFHHLRDLCAKLQVDVFAYEYSGYGESSGVPSEADLYADVDAAYHYLTHDCKIRWDKVVCYGQSVGSVPSIDLASRVDVGGVILHSALKSGLGVIHDMKSTYWFDVFQNVAKIRKVRTPVFVIHGTHDVEVPFDHGVALYEALPPEHAYDPWWVKDAGHNDIEINHSAMYFTHLLRFLRALEAGVGTWKKDEGQEGVADDSAENGWQPLLAQQQGGVVHQSLHNQAPPGPGPTGAMPTPVAAPRYGYEPMRHY